MDSRDDDINKKVEDIFKTKSFSEKIYYDIFDIICKENESYSNNQNGVFVNLSNCKGSTVNKIYDYIQNIEKNNHEHELYMKNTEKKLTDLKNTLKGKQFKIKSIKPKKKITYDKNVLDKELTPKKPVYKGVYKRIYNNMKGYKNKPVTVKTKGKKTLNDEEDVDVDILNEIDDVEVYEEDIEVDDTEVDVDEVDVEVDVDEVKVDEIDETDELFGYESD